MRKYIGVAVILALLLIPLAMRMFGSEHRTAVELGSVEKQTIRATIISSGTTSYDNQVSLSPEVIGRVTAVLVKEGDAVHNGQVLLTIDDSTLRAQFAQAEAQLRIQRLTILQQEASLRIRTRQAQRVKELRDRGFAPQSSFDDQDYARTVADVQLRLSRENYRQATAALQQIREQLNKTVVRAPMSGTVVGVNIKTGETAVPSTIGIAGSSLMTIADTGTLTAELNVDEADVASVSVGQQVQLHILAFPAASIAGVIASVPISPRPPSLTSGAGSGQGRTYTVKTAIRATPGIVLRPGMSCRGEITVLTRKATLTVPVQAVLRTSSAAADKTVSRAQDDDGDAYVFVVAAGRVVKRPVRTGLSDDSREEIVSGVKEGDPVIIGPAKELRVLRDRDPVAPRANSNQ